MAAPDGIKWGSIYGSGTHQGRIGIVPIFKSVGDTSVTIEFQTWFWSEYECSDSNNTFYYNRGEDVTSAATNRGSHNISCTATSQWSTSNQEKLWTDEVTYSRTTAARTVKAYAKLTGVDYVGEAMYVNTSVSIPALPKYTIKFNANGGSGAPASQSKWHGKALTLSSTKPTRTGYTFLGWSASSAATSATWSAGGTYGAANNADDTLYAVWKANTYTIKYDANGGSGAPANQTKTYGKALTLSGTIPTRANYNFVGWATSASGDVAYKAGASYTNNAAATLYAVWELAYTKPRINNFVVIRCTVDDSGTAIADENGNAALVSFDWASDAAIKSVVIEWKESTVTAYTNTATAQASDTAGSVLMAVGVGTLSSEITYDIRVTVTDASGYSTMTKNLAGRNFAIHCKPGGLGVAIGKPAEEDNLFDVAFQTRLGGGVKMDTLESATDLNTLLTPNTYRLSSTRVYLNAPMNQTGAILEIMGDGAIMQRFTAIIKGKTIVYKRFYYDGAWGEWEDLYGWVQFKVSPAPNCTQTTYASRYNKHLSLVAVRFGTNFTPAANIATGEAVPIAIIPENLRAGVLHAASAYRASTVTARMTAAINTSGEFVVRNSGTFSAGTTYTLYGSAMYFLNFNE